MTLKRIATYLINQCFCQTSRQLKSIAIAYKHNDLFTKVLTYLLIKIFPFNSIVRQLAKGTMKVLFMNFLNIFVVSCFVRASNNVEAPCRFANCTGDEQRAVCGLRHAVGGVRVRLFENKCEMQKHGCKVPESEGKVCNFLL